MHIIYRKTAQKVDSVSRCIYKITKKLKISKQNRDISDFSVLSVYKSGDARTDLGLEIAVFFFLAL